MMGSTRYARYMMGSFGDNAQCGKQTSDNSLSDTVTGFLYYILLSPLPPGVPAINLDPQDLVEIGHESMNLFYVNIWLDSMHLTPIPSIAEHPVMESIFNTIMAWSLMLLPAIMADKRSSQVSQR